MSHVEREAGRPRRLVEHSEGADLGIPDDCVRELEKHLAALERGERPDREQLIAQFPAYAAKLRDRLDSLEWIWQLAPELDNSSDVGSFPRWLGGKPRQLGDFRIIREIGRGGMGVVYQAVQVSTGRNVALKVLPISTVLDQRQLVRFKNESRVAATLDHPHIVPVYDVGTEQGVPYYAMRRIEGCSLANVISELRSSTHTPRGSRSAQRDQPRGSLRLPSGNRDGDYFREVARLGIQAAEALDYAHDAGVIHRDIKPANLLIDQHGDLFIADFGLARIEGEVGITMSGDMLGTVRYMSPEQALPGGRCIDQRTDIYSLGITLYELLTLEPAVTGFERQAMFKQIVSGEPRKPRAINHAIPVALETIILKAISKTSVDRYASAGDLAEDLRQFSIDQPIRAKRPTLGKRASRWCRRHLEFLAPVVAALVAALATGVIVAALAWQREREHRWLAERAQQRAEQSEAETQRLLYASNIKLANQAWQEGDLPQFLELLNRSIPKPGQADLRGFEWRYLKQRLHSNRVLLANHLQAAYQICYAPDGRRLAAVGEDSLIRIFDLQTFREEVVMATGQGEVNGLAFAPNGSVCASAADDGTVRIWNLATGSEIRSIHAHSGEAYNVLFADDGNLLVSCGDESTIRVWDAHTGISAGTFDGHQRAVEAIALSPDGRTLASASSDKTARLWDLATRSELRTLTGHDDRLTCIAFSPDGRMVATGSIDKTVAFWDVRHGSLIGQRGQQMDQIQTVAFSSNAKLLAAGDRGGTVRIWHAPRDGQVATSLDPSSEADSTNLLQGHTGRVYSIVFSRDSNQLISAGADGQLIIWSLTDVPTEIELTPVGVTDDLVFTANGQVALASEDGVHVQDTITSEVIRTLADSGQKWQSLAVSPTGLLAAGSKSGAIVVWNLANGEKVQSWNLGESVDRGQLAFSPEGNRLAVASWQHADGIVRLFDLRSGKRVNSFAAKLANVVAFSPDGLQLAADSQNDLLTWNATSGRILRRITGHASTIKSLAFSPDGRYLVSSGKDRTVILWEATTGRLLVSLPGHRDEVWAIAFSPDGRTLVTADQGGVIIVRQMSTGHELLKLEQRPEPIDKLAFSPDGCELAYLLESGATRVIRLND